MLGLEAIAIVLAYAVITAPLVGLVLVVHRLQSDYTRLFLAALVLQIIPIGLIFFPFGFIGLVLLGVTTASTLRRNRRFRALSLDNPAVHRRWTLEALANLLALGLALEQKGVAWLFMDVTARRGYDLLWWIVPGSLLLWLALAPIVRHEWRIFKHLRSSEASTT